MAIGLQNMANIESPDSDFPNGNIKDDTGANDGTPANKQTVADIYQFFAKLMRLASITPNGLPDSEYNGFQYVQAVKKLFGRNGAIQYVGGAASSTVVTPGNNPSIQYIPTAASGHICSLDITDDEADHLSFVTVTNGSANAVTVVSASSYPVHFSAAGYSLAAGQTRTFMFDGQNGPQWVMV